VNFVTSYNYQLLKEDLSFLASVYQSDKETGEKRSTSPCSMTQYDSEERDALGSKQPCVQAIALFPQRLCFVGVVHFIGVSVIHVGCQVAALSSVLSRLKLFYRTTLSTTPRRMRMIVLNRFGQR
jgi:hypothetical protein